MKKQFLRMMMIMVAGVMAISCRLTAKTPIKMETTKIVYTYYTNSGTAITTKLEISRDTIVRDWKDYRHNQHQQTSVKLDGKDFDELINLLSTIQFSVKNIDDTSSGGSGWAYSFETADGRYMYFNSKDKLSGNYEEVIKIISQFIENHPI
jgi:hypothetical protein